MASSGEGWGTFFKEGLGRGGIPQNFLGGSVLKHYTFENHHMLRQIQNSL